MARSNFRIEQGLEIHDPNGTGNVWVISGTGAPAGTSGETADATVGSLYLRQDGEGELYRKVADTDSASDWETVVDKSVYDALGIAYDAENMGSYTGGILTDNEDAHTNIQELSDAVEALESSGTTNTVPAATPTSVSPALVDDCIGVEWKVVVFETATPANREYFIINAVHNGTAVADATSFDDSVHSKLKIADIAGLTFTPVLAGTGAAQTLSIEISATAAVTVHTRRTCVG